MILFCFFLFLDMPNLNLLATDEAILRQSDTQIVIQAESDTGKFKNLPNNIN